MNNTEIARTILNQLGDAKFIAMTGAKQFVAIESGLQLKLPSNFARDGINCVRIVLNASDTYDIEFGKVSGINYKVINTETGIYNDMLQTTFTEVTGLDTSL